ncbi:coiled-coil domain-containing protein 81-like [Cygnus atratus]|uniref:coiled-coil domain-containing protein 81-like n=1 Tax=Cygnus atratus TaxID=8868 RepID=UPI0021B71D46|nr:coiled-coil domain-containing protein 81-like [Cygnus atratus]
MAEELVPLLEPPLIEVFLDLWNMLPDNMHSLSPPNNPLAMCLPDQKSVWDAVSVYIQEHLLLHQGVRIPALGSFDVVPKWVKVGNETIIFLKPVFYMARNLIVSHNLMDNKEYLPGHKELEPLKFGEVAAAASVSWKKVEGCIQGTMSLISRCVGKGENIALVLMDVGVLLIEGTKVQMKFYYEFLEVLSGKENLQKVPQLMDVVVSRLEPVASLTFSGRVIIFPKFEMESVPKPPPRRGHLKAHDGDKQKKEGALPALRQGKKEIHQSLDHEDHEMEENMSVL